MLIRNPVPEFSEEDYYDEQEKNVAKSNRNIYIHDVVDSPFKQYEGANNSYGLVTQVNKMLVRGLPYDSNKECVFDRPINDRVSFIKAMYIYQADFTANNNLEQNFAKAVLRPIYAIVTGIADCNIEFTDQIQESARYLISIHSFENNNLCHIYDTTNFKMNHKNCGARIFSLDIPDPRYNGITLIDNKSRINNCYNIPSRILGEELIRGNTKVHRYISNETGHETMDSVKDKIKAEKGLILPSSIISDIIERQIATKNLLVNMLKGSFKSMFEEFIMIYDSKLGPSVKSIKVPCDGFGRDYFEEYFGSIILDFTKYCERITERFGDVRINLYVNDIEHYVTCLFKDLKKNNHPYSRITVRLTKQECLHEFIFEQAFSDIEINKFSKMHDIDKLEYYEKNFDNGKIRVTIN